MKIYYLNRDGVPSAECTVHSRISEYFSRYEFSKNWIGFASLSLPNGRNGADDFDLILVTHKDIICVELKNWNGRRLCSSEGSWILDGENRGGSPLTRVNLNLKKLATALKNANLNTPLISGVVVLHGEIQDIDLGSELENKNQIYTLPEFLRLTDEKYYNGKFDRNRGMKLERFYEDYKKFFLGKKFKNKVYSYAGYFREPGTLFNDHPNKLYTESLGNKKDSKSKALIRTWEFERLASMMDADARQEVSARERQVYEYIENANPNLCLNLLRPIGNSQAGLDYWEVFAISGHPQRLVDFINGRIKQLSAEDRQSLAAAVLSRFAELHDLGITHNDLAPRDVWLDEKSSVQLTGFSLAGLPEYRALSYTGVASTFFPEGETKTDGTIFSKDIYSLGRATYALLYGEFPKEKGFNREDIPDSRFRDFFESALNVLPGRRFNSARDMFEAFSHLLNSCAETEKLYDPEVFTPFYKKFEFSKYNNIQMASESKWKAIDEAGKKVTISRWYLPSIPSRLGQGEMVALINFLRTMERLRQSGTSNIQEIKDCFIDSDSKTIVYIIEEDIAGGMLLSRYLADEELGFSKIKSITKELIDILEKLHLKGCLVGRVRDDNVFYSEENGIRINISTAFDCSLEQYTSMGSQQTDYSELLNYLNCIYDGITVFDATEQFDNLKFAVKEQLEAAGVKTLSPIIQLIAPYEQFKGFEPVKALPDLGVIEFPIESEDAKILEPEDDGSYSLKVVPHKTKHYVYLVYLAGKFKQILFFANFGGIDIFDLDWDDEEDIEDDDIKAVDSWSIGDIRLADASYLTKNKALKVTGKFYLSKKPKSYFFEELLKSEIFDEALKAGIQASKESSNNFVEYLDEKIISENSSVTIPIIWKGILQAESDAVPKYVVMGATVSESEKSSETSKWYEIYLDRDAPLRELQEGNSYFVQVYNDEKEYWGRILQLDLKKSTRNTLVVRTNRPIEDGDTIRVWNRFEFSSYKRRERALKDFLDGKTRIPDLSKYFEPNESIVSQKMWSFGEIERSDFPDLNDAQFDALNKVLLYGPVGLLQGPPGTGKTRFISQLMYYLIKTVPNVKILLASQSNEAVDHALAKTSELCSCNGFSLDAVRIGVEERVTDDAKWFLEESMEARLKEKLKNQRKDRILVFSNTLGLSQQFVEDVYKLYSSLWVLLKELPEKDWAQNIKGKQFKKVVGFYLSENIQDDVSPETIFEECIDILISVHGVHNLNSVHKLKQLIQLTYEYENFCSRPAGTMGEFYVRSKSVVAGTLVGLGQAKLKLNDALFDWVIIDEASRATASELAIVCQVAQRILLVGDHKQLPPSYSVDLRSKIQHEFGTNNDQTDSLLISDFERAFTSKYGIANNSKLLTQYRMDPVIGTMISKCFYDGNLNNGRASRSKEFADILPNKLRISPLVWVDTSSMYGKGMEKNEVADGVERGYSNEDEARAILKLLKTMFKSEKLVSYCNARNSQEPLVGIICMYSRQRDMIREMVQGEQSLSLHYGNIKINTVDSYQGKENEIIILSTVRNNTRGETGFLKTLSRVNVALSRAKESLVIFGSSRLWTGRSTDPLGKTFAYINDNKLPVLALDTDWE